MRFPHLNLPVFLVMLLLLAAVGLYASWSYAPVVEKVESHVVRAAVEAGVADAVRDGAGTALAQVIDSTAVAAAERNYALLDTIRIQGSEQERRWADVLRNIAQSEIGRAHV